MTGDDPAAIRSALREFYDAHAAERDAGRLPPTRYRLRSEFADLLGSEERSRLVDLGCGTCPDAAYFAEAGADVVGVDISPAHLDRCAAKGVPGVLADLCALPFTRAAFDAGWAMSSLLHISNIEIDAALEEIRRVLRPGAPLGIGLWGGLDREGPWERGDPPWRFFSLRTDERVQDLIGRHFVIEHFETVPDDHEPELHYQYCMARTAS